MKKILMLTLLLVTMCMTAWAMPLPKGTVLAVMDFGTHPGAATSSVELANAEYTSSEYIMAKFIQDGKFEIMEKDLVRDKLESAGINLRGIIDPDSAQVIANALGVRYIVYGNVNDLTASDTGVNAILAGTKVYTVKCHIIARVMDVQNGTIIAAAKGEGKSKSSFTKVDMLKAAIKVGTAELTQDSVHNALQKAAFDVVTKLEKNLGV